MIALWLMVGVSLFFALRGILSSNRLFELPTLAALLYIAFFVPQALAVERNPMLMAYEPWALWLYMSLSLVMIAIGFAIGRKRAKKRIAHSEISLPDRRRVVLGAGLLAVTGLYASYQISIIEAESDLGAAWTGEITAWYLLMQATFFAFAIACLGYLRLDRRNVLLLVALATGISIVLMVNSNVKRHMIAEVFIILTGAWFFIKGKQPPKVLVIVACILGTVLLHQVGSIREYVQRGYGTAIEAIADGVPFREFRYFTSTNSPEIQQAVVDIYSVNNSGTVDGPVGLWNTAVHQYVPAFLLGQEFKDSLQIETNSTRNRDYRLNWFDRFGSTRTGFSDTYLSYGVAGCVVFLLMGAFMGWLYGMALGGRMWAQFYYIILLNDSLIAITESTSRYIVSLPFVFGMTIFFLYPRIKSTRRKERRRTKVSPAHWENHERQTGPKPV